MPVLIASELSSRGTEWYDSVSEDYLNFLTFSRKRDARLNTEILTDVYMQKSQAVSVKVGAKVNKHDRRVLTEKYLLELEDGMYSHRLFYVEMFLSEVKVSAMNSDLWSRELEQDIEEGSF